MNEENRYNIEYTFYIKSLEDFQRQLIEYALAQAKEDDELDMNDLSIAQEMLKEIGVEIN